MASAWELQGCPRGKTEAHPVLPAGAGSYRPSAMDTGISQQTHDVASTLVFRLLAVICPPIVRWGCRLTVTGRELVPAGGCVLCANHLSAFDPWALSVPLLPRQPRYMAKAELFVWPFRSLLRAVGLFPVRRGGGDECAVTTAVGHAKAGRIVLMFPEGARRRNRVLRPRTGAARIALAAGVPLVPAAVRGTDSLFTRWRVAFGAPVPLDDLASLPAEQAVEEATRRLWAHVAALELELAGGLEHHPRSLEPAPTGSEVPR